MNKFEHATVLLKFEKKNYAATRSEVLQGLAKESATALGKLGDDGWELVSVLPYVSGEPFLLGPAGADAALEFFPSRPAAKPTATQVIAAEEEDEGFDRSAFLNLE